MSWLALAALLLALALACLAALHRRRERERTAHALRERSQARERGSHRAQLQYPQVDLARCMGCGACVRACPEEGVLDLVHGQAMVVHGARCVGHARCAEACPTGAIAVALGEIEERRDIPALDERLEVPQVPGLFLAGEVTGFALIRTALAHGAAVAGEVARRRAAAGPCGGGGLDLCIVGAGPAGIACALEAKRRGLDFELIEQEQLGGTVSKYPRQKLVMTQPVDLPLHGRLERTSYSKEELVELWESLAREHELPVRGGVRFEGLSRAGDGTLVVETSAGARRARAVCLALGRRGSPRKLGVPGEELTKVSYGLVDARSFAGQRVLVVGGGDSAVEAALALAEQEGTRVHLSYRKAAFFRLKARNERRLEEALRRRALEVLYESEVLSIDATGVELAWPHAQGEALRIANDAVLVLAGGIPPFGLLERAGVSFDPKDRALPPLVERGSGLLAAAGVALACATLAALWTFVQRDYYGLALRERPAAPMHALLRPSGAFGLTLGIGAALAMATNLAYLLRRAARFPLRFGSLGAWMTVHLATGLCAFLAALLHSAMAPRDTIGGHALGGLLVLLTTGAIGRYFYSFVPRAANGRELDLEETRARVDAIAGRWEGADAELAAHLRSELAKLAEGEHWSGSFLRRWRALASAQWRLARGARRLRSLGREAGLAAEQVEELVALARRSQRAVLAATHYEELRGLLSSWRYLHRWVALLVVLLVTAHVVVALRYGTWSEGAR